MKSRPFAVIAILLIAVAVGAFWFLQSKPAPATLPPAAKATPVPQSTVHEPPAATPPSVAVEKAPATPAPPAAKDPSPPEAPAEWETKIDNILKMNGSETEAAQALINLMPTLPSEGQAEAAQHISNLIEDKDYDRVLPLLKNPNLPEEVQDVLVTDLMNRDDAVKLPAMLEVAKIPTHPYHEEALTDLQIFLDADYGENWQKWDEATKAYLKAQAADETTPTK